MRFWKNSVVIVFLLGVIGFSGYSIYQSSQRPCDQPLKYAIGRFDDEFGVSEAQFKTEIAKAELVWEQALGRDIFVYDPTAKFKINLIYDVRQQTTDQKQRVEFGLEAVEKTFKTLDAEFKSFKAEYDRLTAAHDQAAAEFGARQKSYGDKVSYWNAQGGAPKKEYEALQNEAEYLKSEARELNAEVARLNTRAKELNGLLEERNQAAENYNKIAKNYNEKYGHGLEFDQAEYVSADNGEINVYQFGNKGDLDLALTHELGHALGMEHTLNASSIMYPVSGENGGRVVTPAVEDLSELRRVCHTK